MILHYLKVAWRNLLKYRMQSLISICGIAVGFTAFVLGGYWQYWETHFENFHPNKDQIYAITTVGMLKTADGKEADLNQLHKDDAAFFAKSMPEIKEVCLINEYRFDMEREGQLQRFVAFQVDSTFFNFFWTKFLDGGYKGVVPDGKSVILTARMAKRFFGTVNCVGEEISLEEQKDIRRVAGVIADYPANTELFFDLLVLGKPEYNGRGRVPTYVRFHEQVDIGKARQKIEAHKSVAVDPFGIDVPALWKFKLRALPELHLMCNPDLYNRFRNIRILEIAGWLAFISALMNHLVLFIGQQQKKRKEQLTRTSLGSSRWELMWKSVVDITISILIGFLLSVCLIELVFPFYQEFTTITKNGTVYEHFVNQIDREGIWLRALGYMGNSLLLFLLVSLLPIYWMSKPEHRMIHSTEWTPVVLRRLLIIGQIFIGSLFFISSLVLYKQLYFIKNADKGIHIERIVQISLGFRTAEKINMEVLKKELQESSMVEDVTLTTEPIFSPHGIYYGNQVGYIPVIGRNFKQFKAANEEDYIFIVQENFFQFFGLQLKEGTFISAENVNDYVINETGKQQLGFPDLLQRGLEARGNLKQWKVAGVIKDYHYSPMQYPVNKVFFKLVSAENPWLYYAYVKIKPGCKEQAMQHIRLVMTKYDQQEVSEDKKYVELSSVLDEFNKPEETIFILFTTLALLCILISSFGIYSLVSLSAEQRKKEIAIRKVNGATLVDILHLFLKEYLWLVILGNILALPLGYYLMQLWLETYTYHVEIGVGLFVGVFIITGLIVLFSIFRQVRRAALNNPADALMGE